MPSRSLAAPQAGRRHELLDPAAAAPDLARLGGVWSSQGDVLPPSLVDLLENAPISSVDDLKLLLQQGSTGEADEDEEDEHDFLANRTHGRFTRSLIEAQVAQQAECKVRTEVMEVTRSMVDRRNANFILWPRCVEVQRCSGCCNTPQMQCVPLVSTTRYLKVTKVQFINRLVSYEPAIISVEDHISCRCQRASPSSSLSSSLPVLAPRSPHLQPPHHPHPAPRTVHPAPPKTQSSKADLHRHDDLKHNQQHHHAEEPATRQWQQGSYTQLLHWKQPQGHQIPSYTLPGTQHPSVGGASTVSSRASEARAEHSVMGASTGSGSDSSREDGGGSQTSTGSSTEYTDQRQHQQNLQYHLRTQSRLNTPQSDSASPLSSPTPPPSAHQNPTPPLSTAQKDLVTRRTWVTDSRTETSTQRGEKEESGSTTSGDSEVTTRAKVKDSDVEGHISEEERRQKLLEMVQSEPEQEIHLHPHHPQQRPKPTSVKLAPSTVAPLLPAARRAPFRPASPRRRRKHRKRISKAAIRAMIM
ncbi:uncharacterized protein si:ch211-79m20.1 isoform X1 [Synchiropus splendidus]|uniref:uncharacterized protein si:ch211-79m20.1 isoform X1 n=1 Tax=Synchiropus splendidus TaxID=270530 RepID=UPI00237EE578|nr:uncharacterized protein si:ch211-79m20.1 isoform X1 [Synchiropus splendidus]